MLRERYKYYCERVVKGFYKEHFLRFDLQIVLVDCLQPLNSGPQAFNDMRLALTQLMQSFHYGQRTLFRLLFSPLSTSCCLPLPKPITSRSISTAIWCRSCSN